MADFNEAIHNACREDRTETQWLYRSEFFKKMARKKGSYVSPGYWIGISPLTSVSFHVKDEDEEFFMRYSCFWTAKHYLSILRGRGFDLRVLGDSKLEFVGDFHKGVFAILPILKVRRIHPGMAI